MDHLSGVCVGVVMIAGPGWSGQGSQLGATRPCCSTARARSTGPAVQPAMTTNKHRAYANGQHPAVKDATPRTLQPRERSSASVQVIRRSRRGTACGHAGSPTPPTAAAFGSKTGPGERVTQMTRSVRVVRPFRYPGRRKSDVVVVILLGPPRGHGARRPANGGADAWWRSGRYRAAPAGRRASYCAAVIGYRCSPRAASLR